MWRWDSKKLGENCAHRCLSILPASLYFLSSLRSTLCLLIHWTLVGIRASAVPFLLPVPVCLPFLLAASSSFVRAREWTTVGLTMTWPSLMSLVTCLRELALPISACSAGSSQILRLPTPAMLAARRFCERRLTVGCVSILGRGAGIADPLTWDLKESCRSITPYTREGMT